MNQLLLIQKGVVKLAYYNIVLSKKEIVKRIEEIIDIEIVNKGIIKIGLDTTKYYIRINFDDKTNFLFGESVNFFSIQEKFRFLVASIKEAIKELRFSRKMDSAVREYSKNPTEANKQAALAFFPSKEEGESILNMALVNGGF